MKNVACEHGKQKGHCRVCRPEKYCTHDIHKSHCRVHNPIGWAKGILSVARGAARRRGYAAPQMKPETLALMGRKHKLCCLCGGKLKWNGKTAPHMHHDHKTGEVHGFAHQWCNQAEGMLSKLTEEERKRFVWTALGIAPGNEGQ